MHHTVAEADEGVDAMVVSARPIESGARLINDPSSHRLLSWLSIAFQDGVGEQPPQSAESCGGEGVMRRRSRAAVTGWACLCIRSGRRLPSLWSISASGSSSTLRPLVVVIFVS